QPAALFRIEGRVRRKETARCTEVGVPACRRGGVSVQGGVGIKHLEIVGGQLFQGFGSRIAVRRAKKDLPEAERDPSGKIRYHSAHVVGDDFAARPLTSHNAPVVREKKEARGGGLSCKPKTANRLSWWAVLSACRFPAGIATCLRSASLA